MSAIHSTSHVRVKPEKSLVSCLDDVQQSPMYVEIRIEQVV